MGSGGSQKRPDGSERSQEDINIMPYTEKQELGKLNAAMTVYRVFLYSVVVCFLLAVPALRFWNVVAELFMLAGFTWHLISLRGLYLKEPEKFQTRPKLIALLLVIGLSVRLIFLFRDTLDYLQFYSGGIVSVRPQTFLFYELYPDGFVRNTMYYHTQLALVSHVIAIILLVIMLVLFSQFKAIHNALEVSGQTTALADSDPLGIADELRKFKTPRSGH